MVSENPAQLAVKRLVDIALAGALLFLASPVMLLAALWIKLSSRGPAFFRQIREGFRGERLAVWKLRTMHMDADHLLEDWLDAEAIVMEEIHEARE